MIVSAAMTFIVQSYPILAFDLQRHDLIWGDESFDALPIIAECGGNCLLFEQIGKHHTARSEWQLQVEGSTTIRALIEAHDQRVALLGDFDRLDDDVVSLSGDQ